MILIKPICIALMIVALSACSEANGRRSVMDYFATNEVVAVPDNRHNYIARKPDGSIWYAFSSGISDKSINHIMLLPPASCAPKD